MRLIAIITLTIIMAMAAIQAARSDPVMRDTVQIGVSTAFLRATDHPGAIAEMVFDNRVGNYEADVHGYRAVLVLPTETLVIPFNFQWQTGRSKIDDAIVLHPPEGISCLPVDCRMQVKEYQIGTLYLFRGQGVGM